MVTWCTGASSLMENSFMAARRTGAENERGSSGGLAPRGLLWSVSFGTSVVAPSARAERSRGARGGRRRRRSRGLDGGLGPSRDPARRARAPRRLFWRGLKLRCLWMTVLGPPPEKGVVLLLTEDRRSPKKIAGSSGAGGRGGPGCVGRMPPRGRWEVKAMRRTGCDRRCTVRGKCMSLVPAGSALTDRRRSTRQVVLFLNSFSFYIS